MVDNMNIKKSVADTFDGQTVFLTGATGFLGKLTLEKLLRACPGIKKIYIVVRSKKGKDENQRRTEIFENEIFEPLKRKTAEIFETKVEVLSGDLILPNLGLSEADQKKLIAEVNFVLHLAATVRFDEKIKTAVAINVKATRDLLKLAKQMKNLKGFVYVSTAYSYCPLKEIDEQFYEPPYEVDKIINLVDPLDNDMLDYLTPKLLKEWPNTYVLTKSIAEQVIRTESAGLPLVMVRPSIVMSTYLEPLGGWTDNFYGALGALVGGALGLIKTMWVKFDNVADLVPADYVVNCVIVSAWDVANNRNEVNNNPGLDSRDERTNKIKIYNYVSGAENPITWADMYSYTEKIGPEVPSLMCVWHYFFVTTESKTLYKIYCFLLHTVPAHLVDFVAKIIGKKPQLVNGYKKIHKFLEVIHYFSTRQWTFHNKNTQKLWYKLNPDDRTTFQFNIKAMKWEHFFYMCIRGARVYLIKDPMDTLEEGKAHYRRLKIYHYSVMTIVIVLLLVFLYFFFKTVFNILF